MPQERKSLRIGLLWHSLTSGNLGVGALTHANIAIVRGVAEQMNLAAELVILGMRDGPPPPLHDGISSYAIDGRSMISPSGFWRQLTDLDLVIDIGAGDSFAEIYGPKRFAYLWLTKALTLARGKPLILAPQTIGPFTKGRYRRLAAPVMNRAAAVVARDQISFDILKEIAPHADAHLATDVAFVLPFVKPSKGSVGKIRIGLNVSGLLFAQAENGQNRFGLSYDYAALMRQLLTHWSAQDDIELNLIAHATSTGDAGDDDGRRADMLALEFPRAIRVPNFAGPSEAKSFIAQMDFVVAARMHACIAAFSAGVAVVPISYSRKFSGLFGTLDYPWLTPVQGMDEDAAFRFIINAAEQRETLAADAVRGMEQVERRLDNYRAVLTREFSKVSQA